MTDQHAAEQTAAPRRNGLRYAAIAAAVLAVVAGIILLVKVTGDSAPVDYRVTVSGNINATWTSDDGTGKLNLYDGIDTQTIHAGSLTVTVNSTMPDGATCKIVDPDGNTIDSQSQRPAAGVTGMAAWTTVTCSTKKP
jgi:hypothetical protein